MLMGAQAYRMVSNLDIWRAANLLIREHGADAELEAARLQDLMLDRGDGRDAASGPRPPGADARDACRPGNP